MAPETKSKLAQLPPLLVLQMCNLWVRVDGLLLRMLWSNTLAGRCEFMAQFTPYIPQSKNMKFLGSFRTFGMREPSNLFDFPV